MKDQLSALIDGEFDVASAAHLITSVQSGGEMESCWQQYHLIGDAMRGDRYLSADFSARVMSALDAEATVLAPRAAVESQIIPKKSTFQLNQFWSIAASVAAVMFVGLMVLQQQLTSSEEAAPVEMAQIVPLEYIEAHQAAAPSGAAYYIQNVNANMNSAGQ